MTMATTYRSVLSDVFREAIVNGRVVANPVEPTRTPTIKVKRERLELETFISIRHEAEVLPVWFRNGMDLALVTGQRREDIVEMRFSEIRDNRLHVVHIKTGMMIAISWIWNCVAQVWSWGMSLNAAGKVILRF
jgi:integrase